jgi:hypothetical protein
VNVQPCVILIIHFSVLHKNMVTVLYIAFIQVFPISEKNIAFIQFMKQKCTTAEFLHCPYTRLIHAENFLQAHGHAYFKFYRTLRFSFSVSLVHRHTT